jgi:hypothetical protein
LQLRAVGRVGLDQLRVGERRLRQQRERDRD